MKKMIKTFISISLLGFLLFGVSACDENDKGVRFSNKEDALKHFIQEEDVKGNIDLVLTVKDENLLVVQTRDRTYFVGEMVKDKNGYYTNKISVEYEIPSGAGWELNTSNNNEYTIYFEMDKEAPNTIQLSNEEYSVLLVEGHTLTNHDLPLTSAIKKVKTIKD